MSNKKIVFITLLTLLLSLSAQISAQTVKFEPVTHGQFLQAPVDEKFTNAVRIALVTFNWRIVSEEPGVIYARYEKSNGLIVADIKIALSADAYTIEYVDSKGLDANLETKAIHRNYPRWIANLDKNIYLNYLK